MQKLCKAAGITVAECFAPFEDLPKILAEKGGHDYNEDQIRGELQRLRGGKNEIVSNTEGEGMMAVLSEIINSIGRADLEKTLRIYQGYYYAYVKWFDWEKSENFNDPQIAIYKFLIKIDEIDEKQNIIKVKLTTYSHLTKVRNKLYENNWKWGYQGIMVPIGERLYFIFEQIYEPVNNSSYVFIITHDRPVLHLLGLLTAESMKEQRLRFQPRRESFIACTRIVLIKIDEEEVNKGEDCLMEQVGYYEPHELKELSPELLEDLNRESKNGIFTAF